MSWYCITFNYQMRSFIVKLCPGATQRAQRKLQQKNGAFADVSINEKQKKIKVWVVEAPNPVFLPGTVTSQLQGENIVKALSELQTMFLTCELCSKIIINQVSHFLVLQISFIAPLCPSMPWWRACTTDLHRYVMSDWTSCI